MRIDLKKAKVLITGGSDGIGKSLAKRFLEGGSQVLITGRDREKLAKAIEELPGVLTLENDISDPAQRGFGQTEDLVVQLSGKSQESLFASSAEKSAVNVYHL